MIHINCHEPHEIIKLLQAKIEIQVSNFTPADYVIGTIGIERKTINDFLQSLVDKRLFEQLQRMKSCYPCSFLIIEAYDLSHFQNTNFIYGAILHILITMNIKIIFTQTKEQTAAVLLLIAGRVGNSGNERVPIIKHKHVYMERQQRTMLESIPNVGRKRAKILLKHFGSLQKIFSAKREELRKVEEIGQKTARNIMKIVRMRR